MDFFFPAPHPPLVPACSQRPKLSVCPWRTPFPIRLFARHLHFPSCTTPSTPQTGPCPAFLPLRSGLSAYVTASSPPLFSTANASGLPREAWPLNDRNAHWLSRRRWDVATGAGRAPFEPRLGRRRKQRRMHPAGSAAAGTPRQRKWRTWPAEVMRRAGCSGAAAAVGEVAAGQRSGSQGSGTSRCAPHHDASSG